MCGASGKVTCSTTEHGADLPPVFLIGKPGEERRQERGGGRREEGTQTTSAQWTWRHLRYDTDCYPPLSGDRMHMNKQENSKLKTSFALLSIA